MPRKTILEVRVKDLEKRRYPTKHYVYVLEVSWSEGSSTLIYRRYSDFFEFQCALLERFPEEAGARDPASRMIPFLPGKKLLGRSHTRSVAEKRKDKIDDYCRALIRLPPKISDDLFVIDFFEVRPEDIYAPTEVKRKGSKENKVSEISDPILLERYVAIADYEKQKKNECSLMAGQTVEVVDKNQNGWWFVNVDDFHEGWVPATYLEPLYGEKENSVEVFDPGEEELFLTTSPYNTQHDDEIGFERGVVVEVFEKGLDGWWRIRYGGKEGLAPAAYMRRYHGPASEATAPTQIVFSVKDAVQSTTGAPPLSPNSPKSPETKRKQHFQPSWHAQPINNKWKDEPIYAPTPRRRSLKKLLKKVKPDPPRPYMGNGASAQDRISSSSTPPSSPTEMELLDQPEPVYEIIPEPEEEIYLTIADFNAAQAGDGLSFQAGVAVSVITKNATGWWFVEMGEQEGWVPSSYLERKSKTPSPVCKSPTSPAPPLPAPNPARIPVTPMQKLSSKSTGSLLEPGKKSALKKSSSSDNFLVSLKPVKPLAAQRSPGARKKQKSSKSPAPPISPYRSKSAKEGGAFTAIKPTSPTRSSRPSNSTTLAGKPTPPALKSSPLPSKTTPLPSKTKTTPLPSKTTLLNKPTAPSSRPSKATTATLASGPPRKVSAPISAAKTPPSLRTLRLGSSLDDIEKPQPVPRKATLSKTLSSGESPRPALRTAQPKAAAKPTLTVPTPATRSTSVGTRPRRPSIEEVDTPSRHRSELEQALQKRTPTSGPSSSSRQYPSRPKPPPPGSTKKVPPKRPEPPKLVGGARKQPPRRPTNSPALKKQASYTTICEYSGSTDGCLSFKEGERVEVLEKSDDGWWFVKSGPREGWAPASFIEEQGVGDPVARPPRPSNTPAPIPKPVVVKEAPKPKPRPRPRNPAAVELYRAASSYDVPSYEDSGVALVKGRVYEVLEKNEGWWYVKDGDNEGWAPASYLDPV